MSEQRAALSKELSEFLVEFSIALHKHAMYPDGHPSLAPAASGVVRRADTLMQDIFAQLADDALTLRFGIQLKNAFMKGDSWRCVHENFLL